MRIRTGLAVAACGWAWFCTAMAAAPVSEWRATAEEAYQRGFVENLRRHAEGGVGLFDMVLIENDAAGAGTSRKGVNRYRVWGPHRARKILPLADARAERAFLVLFFEQQGGHPLEFTVNGHAARIDNWDRAHCHLVYRWVEFPAGWLRAGDNTIDLFCPAAENANDGWSLYLARADEFEAGGGDPSAVGRSSFVSVDDGRTWQESGFGADGTTRAEYSVRLSLDRHVPQGWLGTPVIDLWRVADDGPIMPVRLLQQVSIRLQAEIPEGTRIDYYLRRGRHPGPRGPGWSEYEPLVLDAPAEYERVLAGTRQDPRGIYDESDLVADAARMDARWIQLKAVLTTTTPLATPRLLSLEVVGELMQPMPRDAGQRALLDSLWVAEIENPEIRYSSLEWAWEAGDRPEFAQLRARENLDQVVAGSRTQFETISRLLAYATVRAPSMAPDIQYPGWDAHSILERAERLGGLGFCLQFNNLVAGLCAAYGMQGRLVNGVNHEMAEVWSDDFGKWVFVEASGANHFLLDPETGVPLNLLDLHERYLDLFFADRAIDWMNDLTAPNTLLRSLHEREGAPPVLRSSSTYHADRRQAYKGLVHSGFLRMIPRNDYYARPHPMPLAQGTSWWPWDGYVNWYDERTPPKRQYSRFTDRAADLWPDLNLTRLHATRSQDNRYLYLAFETYTPNFSHFEVNENDTGWQRIEGDRRTWVLAPGRNTLLARAVNRSGVGGKPARWTVHRRETSLPEWY